MQTTSEISEVIFDFIRESFPGFDSRTEDQAEGLRETNCTNPVIGRWLNAYDVEYLLSAFAMTDRDFAEEFPGMPPLSGLQRQQVLAALRAHLNSCPQCALKSGFDQEFEARLKQELRQNSQVLLELLEEEGVTSLRQTGKCGKR